MATEHLTKLGWLHNWIIFLATSVTKMLDHNRCSPDNSACEGVFGRMKNEMFYYASWAGYSIEQFICAIDQYLHWYCEKRIKLSLGGMSPLEYRRSKGLLTQSSTSL